MNFTEREKGLLKTFFSSKQKKFFGAQGVNFSISEILKTRYVPEFREESLTSVSPFSILRTDKNPDVLFIQPETLASWMNKSNGSQPNVILLDCRYGYEYKGGHIKGAHSITGIKDLRNAVFTRNSIDERRACMIDEVAKDSTKTPIIVFYCENSTKRGPKGFRAFRDLDREMDTNILPSPYYPFVYVLNPLRTEEINIHLLKVSIFGREKKR